MSKLTLIPGQKVRHVKTGNVYTILDLEHLHKVANDWVASISYQPLNTNSTTTYSRDSKDFCKEFVNA